MMGSTIEKETTMSEDIARADEFVEAALALPEKDRGHHLATAITGLVGMTAETDESRVAQATETDRLREENDYLHARVEHLEKKMEEHGIADDFEYSPRPRRKRSHTAMSMKDILVSALGLIPTRAEAPVLREATPTGSITSLPKQRESDIERDVTAAREAARSEEIAPAVMAVEIDESPLTSPTHMPTYDGKHPTRGFDHIPVGDVWGDELATGRIFLSPPKSAGEIVKREDRVELEVTETRRERKRRRADERAQRRSKGQ